MGACRNTLIAAISNLSTAYNLVVINIVKVIVASQYCGGYDKCNNHVSLAATSCLVGAIFGQLSFGYIGDCVGRSAALQLTMALSIIGAVASAFAVPLNPADPPTIFYFLSLTRFVLGVGVGGVYPLSATIAAESASSEASRGRAASLVFSMQGLANLVVPLLAMAMVYRFGQPLAGSRENDPGWSWRVTLAAGAVPGLLLAPFKVAETLHRLSQRLTDTSRLSTGRAFGSTRDSGRPSGDVSGKTAGTCDVVARRCGALGDIISEKCPPNNVDSSSMPMRQVRGLTRMAARPARAPT